MKSVVITIEGTLQTYEYCSRQIIDKHIDSWTGFSEGYFTINGWTKVYALFVDGDRTNNLRRKKGWNLKTSDYLHRLFSEDGGHPLPVELHKSTTEQYTSLDYVIELEDDEEFDIKKVQLVYSNELMASKYSVKYNPLFPDFFFSFILAEKIVYDGKEFKLAEDDVDKYYDFWIKDNECEKVVIKGWEV